MTVQLIEITEDVADRFHVLTEPAPCQIGDARMIIVDLPIYEEKQLGPVFDRGAARITRSTPRGGV